MEHLVKTPNKPTDSAIFKETTACDLFVRDDKWFVSGEITKLEAQTFLDNHNPPAPTLPTVAEKLAIVGLSIDDLKAALGV